MPWKLVTEDESCIREQEGLGTHAVSGETWVGEKGLAVAPWNLLTKDGELRILLFICFIYSFLFFELEFWCFVITAQAGLKLRIFLPWPPGCWGW